MDIWVIVRNEHGEISTSTHLTEKGALLLALAEVMDYLNLRTAETYRNFLEYHNLDGETLPLGIWKRSVLEQLPKSILWDVWGFWGEFWYGQGIDWYIDRTQVQP